MTFQVIIQPEAEREIRQQARWLVHQSRVAGHRFRWVRCVRSKIDSLKTHAQQYPVDSDSDIARAISPCLANGVRWFIRSRVMRILSRD